MTHYEVNSISNGLERCTMLLKDILDQDQQEPQRLHVTKKKRNLNTKTATRLAKPWQVSSKKTAVVGKTKNNLKSKSTHNLKRDKVEKVLKTTEANNNNNNITPRPSTAGPWTKFDEDIPSSTPIITPIKRERLPTKQQQQQNHANSLTSSQSSLIALLQNFNNSTLLQEQCNRVQAPSKAANEPVRIPHSGGDGQPHEIVADDTLTEEKTPHNKPTPYKEKYEDLNTRLTAVQSENGLLKRKVKALEASLKEKESSSNNDISLEVATVKCRNNLLEKKVVELTAALDESVTLQADMSKTNVNLVSENQELRGELMMKDDELKKSGRIFTDETENIKLEVNQAMLKFEHLKNSLIEADTENADLKNAVNQRDAEIERLNELNKGLQNSVSRLLADLNKPKQVSPVRNGHDMSNMVLSRLDNILSRPVHHTQPQRTINDKPYFGADLDIENQQPTKTSPKQIITTPGPERHPQFKMLSPISTIAPTPSMSMISISTSDEHHFSTGLANLDADIERLQNSLKQVNVGR